MITNPSPYNLWLLIILKVLLIKSEKRFEDYKILNRETSEITRKKFTKIVKSEINKISINNSQSFQSANKQNISNP